MLCISRSSCWYIRLSVTSNFDHKTHSVNMKSENPTWNSHSFNSLSCDKPKKYPAQIKHHSPWVLSSLQWICSVARLWYIVFQSSSLSILFISVSQEMRNEEIRTSDQNASHTGNLERGGSYPNAPSHAHSGVWQSLHVSFLIHLKEEVSRAHGNHLDPCTIPCVLLVTFLQGILLLFLLCFFFFLMLSPSMYISMRDLEKVKWNFSCKGDPSWLKMSGSPQFRKPVL